MTVAGVGAWAGPAVAQSGSDAPAEVTVVRGIAVDATAESAVVARETALRDGQRRALDQVLRRVTLREDWPRLPTVGAADLPSLVSTLEISDEKTSSVRYLAKLTVGFNEGRIKSLLRSAGVPYTITRAEPALLLPVMEQAGVLLLFDETNDWLQAWERAPTDEDSLLPLRLPLGDLQDITAVSAEAAVSGGPARLREMAKRYGAGIVIVAHAIPSAGVAGSFGSSLTVHIAWHDDRGTQTQVLSVPGASGEDPTDTMLRAAREVAIELEQIWKRRTLLVFGSEVTLSVFAPINGLDDWIVLRNRLGKVTMVQDFELTSISRRVVQLRIRFLGVPERMELPLAQQGLELRQVEGYWQLGWRGQDAGMSSGATAR